MRPDSARRFLCYDKHPKFPSSWDLLWDERAQKWDDGNGAFWLSDEKTRAAFTHFLEITPP